MDVTTWLMRAEKALILDLNHLKHVKLLIVEAWDWYGQQLSDTRLHMFAERLFEYSIPQLERAIAEWHDIKESIEGRTPRAPYPKDLIERINPSMTVDDEANAIASRIIKCIGGPKTGYNRPEAAREAIGEVGWAVVQERGGWANVSMMEQKSVSTTHAQFRDIARGIIPRHKAQKQRELEAGVLRAIEAPKQAVLGEPEPQRYLAKMPHAIGAILQTVLQRGAGKDTLEQTAEAPALEGAR